MVKRRTLVWPATAVVQLRLAYEHIKKDSEKNAAKVRTEIMNACKELLKHPEKYPPDKHRYENDGTFRAFELYHYRIVYMVTESEIVIVRVRHTAMEPLLY